MVAKGTDSESRAEQKRQEALSDAIQLIEKLHGKGSIMRLGDNTTLNVAGFSTGSLGLDLACGGQGLPRGRIIEIFGPESSGKTTLTLHAIASVQKAGGMAAFIDAEHAIDPQYARKLGVDLDALLISQPDHGEQALDIVETLLKSSALDLVVVDSVAALVPKAEIEGEMGDQFVGLHARLMSKALRKLTGLAHKTDTSVVFINQIREKIGVMFGSPETTTGGRALKFYASIRLDIRRIGQIKSGDQTVGARTKVTVVKNKVAPPFRKVEFDILFNVGINVLGELIDMGVEHGVLKRSGTWLSYGDQRLGQGRDRAREFLTENPEVVTRLRGEILAKVAPVADPADAAAENSGDSAGSAAPVAGKTASGGGRTTSSAGRTTSSAGRAAGANATADAKAPAQPKSSIPSRPFARRGASKQGSAGS